MSAFPCGLCPNREPFETALKLQGHFSRVHKLTKLAYVTQFPEASAWYPREVVAKEPSAPKADPVPADQMLSQTEQTLALLSLSERQDYDKYYEDFFQQLDRDTAQVPMLESLVFDIIQQKRLRIRLMRVNISKDDREETNLQIKEVAKRIADTMKILELSRDRKLANRKSVSSSVAALFSGYMDEIERKSVEELTTMVIEENKALADSEAQTQRWIISAAPDLLAEDEDENGDTRIPTVEEIVRQAGITT